jgi:hypothetical protein
MLTKSPERVKKVLIRIREEFPELQKRDLIDCVVEALRKEVPMSDQEITDCEEYVNDLVNNFY